MNGVKICVPKWEWQKFVADCCHQIFYSLFTPFFILFFHPFCPCEPGLEKLFTVFCKGKNIRSKSMDYRLSWLGTFIERNINILQVIILLLSRRTLWLLKRRPWRKLRWLGQKLEIINQFLNVVNHNNYLWSWYWTIALRRITSQELANTLWANWSSNSHIIKECYIFGYLWIVSFAFSYNILAWAYGK